MNTYEVKRILKRKEPYQTITANDPKHAAITFCLQNKILKTIVHVRKYGKYSITTKEGKFRKKIVCAIEV